MAIKMMQGDPCPRCGNHEWQVNIPDPPKSKLKSGLAKGGVTLAMLGVTFALSAWAEEPVASEDVGTVLNASVTDDHPKAVCVNCGKRFELPGSSGLPQNRS